MQHADKDLPCVEPAAFGRRELLRLAGVLGASPLLSGGSLAAQPGAASTKHGSHSRGGVYERMLGVPTIINASGPVTAFGGTTLSKEVTAAMAEAARSYVDLNELYSAAGARLAQITKAPAAMVTSGAFAAMTFGAAACLAGTDAAKWEALPQPTWPRREAVLQRAHSTPYDRAYRNAGMTIVYVDTEEQMLAAIGERTAMVAGLTMVEKMNKPGIISPERLVAIGKQASVPVFLDASFSLNVLPNVAQLSRYTEMGADLVGISGGKGMHAPQSTGILAGRADLIAAARAQASPNPAGFGRGLKVDKEEVIGLLVALEQFLSRDHEAIYRRNRKRVDTMRGHLQDVPGLRFGYEEVFFGPGLVLMWDEAQMRLTYDQFMKQMHESERPIFVRLATGPTQYFVADVNGPALFADSLNDSEERIVARRAKEILLAGR
jgi:D-glucosaminate-6-phosphate ammonia-lyase